MGSIQNELNDFL